MLVGSGLRGEMFEIVFSCKIYPVSFHFTRKLSDQVVVITGKRFFILLIVEINCMTQIKENTGICKSVFISRVVAIRDIVKNGFHCT